MEQSERIVSLIFKSSSHSDVELSVPLSTTITSLKTRLTSSLTLTNIADSHALRLIFAGRVLLDDELLSTVLPSDRYDLSQRHTMHLVIRSSSVNNPASAMPAPQSPYATAAFGGAYGGYAGYPGYNGLGQPLGNINNFVPYPAQMAHGAHMNPQQFPPMHQHRHVARIVAIDFGLILKLCLGVYLLSTGGGQERLAFLVAIAIATYIYFAGIGRRVEFDENGNEIPQNDNNGANNNPGANNNDAIAPNVNALPFWAREERGPVLTQISAFFIPLFQSLSPYWKMPDLSLRQAVPPANADNAANNNANEPHEHVD
jgi:hypothetical protein